MILTLAVLEIVPLLEEVILRSKAFLAMTLPPQGYFFCGVMVELTEYRLSSPPPPLCLLTALAV